MIYSLAILPMSRRGDPPAKIPPNVLARTVRMAGHMDQMRTGIAVFWAQEFGADTLPSNYFVQLDIIEGRKPAGFKFADAAGKLGHNVRVTRKVRP